MKKLSSSSEFVDFEVTPRVLGKFLAPVKREKDGNDENQKAGDVIGYEFELENGDTVLVGNSYVIQKAITMVDPGSILGVTFRGKTTNAKNQPVNLFEVLQFDDFFEGKEYYTEKDKQKEEAESL